MTLKEWRAFYAELGFATIPLVHHGKRPLRRGWLERGDEQWVGVPEGSNIGILTGARSGNLVVLDFDTKDGPERHLGMTPAQLAVVTIVIRTHRGWHVYARGEVQTGTPMEGLDIRAERAMVVAPPSVHASGDEYAFAGVGRSVVALDAIWRPAHPSEPAPRAQLREDADAWVEVQAPKLREAWRRLNEPASASWDASKADFAIARCLWECGWSEESVADLLLELPGSRARERGRAYALLTAMRARRA